MNEPTELEKARHLRDDTYDAFITVKAEYDLVRKRFEECELEWRGADEEYERIKGED